MLDNAGMDSMKLTLKEKIQEASDVFTFVFEPPKPIEFKAGQFLFYTLKHENSDERGENRYFTNSAAPHEGVVRITTRFAAEKGSSFKASLGKFAIGDEIFAMPPDGDFIIEKPAEKMLFLAGGIGITPFRSILLDLGRKKEIKDIVLLYANRNSEIVFKDELGKIAAENPGLKIFYLVDPEKITAETIKKSAPDFSERVFYISGPKPMVKAMEEMIQKELGVVKKKIRTDYFPGYAGF